MNLLRQLFCIHDWSSGYGSPEFNFLTITLPAFGDITTKSSFDICMCCGSIRKAK